MASLTLIFLLIFYGIAHSDESSNGESSDSDSSDESSDGGSNFLQQSNVQTHNSYHIRQHTTFTTLIDPKTEIPVFVPVAHYSYPSLSTLLDNDVFGLEIDIWPKENPTDVDFPVYHVYQYDKLSTCTTLSECLKEVNQWMKNNEEKQSIPIYVQLEVKTSLDNYSDEDLMEINQIVENSFDSDVLYTPKSHGAKPTDEHWPGFDQQDGITNNNVWLDIDVRVIERLYPSAINVADDDDDPNAYENQYNLFVRCADKSYARYCVILSSVPGADLGKYVFRTFVGSRFLQLPEYPFIPVGNGDYVVQLPPSVTKDADYWVAQFGLPADTPTSIVPYKWWNAWMILATFDGMGNNDGIIDVEEVAGAVYQYTERNEAARALTVVVLTTEDIWGLGIPLTLDGMYVNNPLAWIGLAGALDSGPGEVLSKQLVPDPDLDGVIMTTCQAIKDGYTYIKTDYPYQLDEPYQNGNVWPYTFRDVDCSTQSAAHSHHKFNILDKLDHSEKYSNHNSATFVLTLSETSIVYLWCFIIAFVTVTATLCYFLQRRKGKSADIESDM